MGILADIVIANISNRRKIKFSVGKVRIHHSFHGIILIIIGIFIYRELLIGLGLGLVIGHTIRNKKIEFIEKRS